MAVQVDVFERNLEVDEGLRQYVIKKASQLGRYLREIDHARVDLDYIKSARSATDRYVAQITVKGGKAILRTEERADELRTAFDKTIDKMQRQLERYKGKHYRGRGGGRAVVEFLRLETKPAISEHEGIISRRKTFDLMPMSESDALEQMTLLGFDNFFIFLNIETDSICVLYRRSDDTFGLIEPKVP